MDNKERANAFGEVFFLSPHLYPTFFKIPEQKKAKGNIYESVQQTLLFHYIRTKC